MNEVRSKINGRLLRQELYTKLGPDHVSIFIYEPIRTIEQRFDRLIEQYFYEHSVSWQLVCGDDILLENDMIIEDMSIGCDDDHHVGIRVKLVNLPVRKKR